MSIFKLNITHREWFILIILFQCILPPTIKSQDTAKFIGLGHLPGGTSSRALDVSANGFVVIGGYSAGAVQAGFIWTETNGFQPINNFFIPRSVSGDGSVIVGPLSGTTLAGMWVNGSTSQLPAIWTGVNASSHAMGVSADGATIVGYSTSTEFGVQQCTRWAGGQPVGLGLGPGGDASYAYNISPDGTAIVGTFRLDQPSPDQISHAFLSMNGGNIQSLGAGAYLESQAWGVSNGGNVVVGALTAVYSGPLTAAKWTLTSGWEPLHGTVGSNIAYDVSADGSIIVGSMSNFTSAFIWDQNHGARDLKTVLENEYQLDLTGWTLTNADAIDSSGTVIVGYGSHNGKTEAWYAKLPRLKITKPAINMKWIAGEKDTIKWNGGKKNQFLQIDYSSDSGKTFNIIDFIPNGDTGLYVWDIPINILSKKCMIRVVDMADTTIADTSDVFKIKGYILTRDSSGQYEPYRREEDQWGFWNQEADMFPQPWYQQFFYQGIDPFTGSQYSQWQGGGVFSSAKSSAFPDWVSWVNAFGVSACYAPIVGTSLGIYSPTALHKWDAVNNSWNGSCFGIAISNALAFSYKDQFQTKYNSILPAFANPITVLSNAGVKTVVNEIYTHQLGNPHYIFRSNVALNKTPTETVNDLKQMLREDAVEIKTLSFVNNGPTGGGHAILVYGLRQDPAQKKLYYVDVYDNSNPNSNNPITIDTTGNGNNGTWSTPDWPGWGGNKWIYLRDPAVTYLLMPTMAKRGMQQSPFILEETELQIFNPTSASIRIKDDAGNITGFYNNVIHADIPSSVPLIVDNPVAAPPYGYSLPTDNYSVIVDNFASDTVNIFFFTGNKSFSFKRNDAEQNQTDRFFFDGGISVANHDQQSKTVSLLNIINETTQEKLFSFSLLELSQNDSVKIENPDSNKIKLISYGTAKDYDIELNYVAGNGIGRFGDFNIPLISNTSHTIVPDWTDITNTELKIFIDEGNDGSVDDTLSLTNKLTGIGNDHGSLIPTEFKLEQNYPNPFNPSTTVSWQSPVGSWQTLKVYDVLGNEIATLINEYKSTGRYKVEFDASELSSGIYFYRLQAGSFVETKKMILLR